MQTCKPGNNIKLTFTVCYQHDVMYDSFASATQVTVKTNFDTTWEVKDYLNHWYPSAFTN